MSMSRKIPIPPKEQQEKFYSLIGKLTLVHAGIEQDLKGVLIEDWKFPEAQIEKLYGKDLRKGFLKKIRARHVSEIYCKTYSELMNRFTEASEQRNDLIKATYGYLEPSDKIFRYDLKLQRTYKPEMRFNDGHEKDWMKIVSLDDLEMLIKELGQIREGIFQLSKKIHLERAVHGQGHR